MEEKSFELLTKMYSEFSQFRKEVNEKLDKKSDKNDIIQLENKQSNDAKALFDGYKQTYEKIQTLSKEQNNRFDSLDNKVEALSISVNKHESKFEVLEGGKK